VCGTPGTSSSTATPCCAGNTCTGGCCITRYSTSSSGNQVCMAVGSACDTLYTSSTNPVCDLTTLAGGSCTGGTAATSPCGGIGQACCVSSYLSSSSYYYCGAPGSHCVYSTSSTTGATQYLCQACGGNGQPCCVSSTTTAGACAAAYQCTYNSSSGAYTCAAPTTTGP
jgi:hypothetical protein